jgi:DNA-binding Xre family transcriptional regulator
MARNAQYALSNAHDMPEQIRGKQMANEIYKIDLTTQRQRRGYSIPQLAEIAGLNRANLYEIEAGRTTAINLQVLSRLCAALHCSPADLLRPTSDVR